MSIAFYNAGISIAPLLKHLPKTILAHLSDPWLEAQQLLPNIPQDIARWLIVAVHMSNSRREHLDPTGLNVFYRLPQVDVLVNYIGRA